MNICVHISLWTYALNSLKYIPRSRIARSYGNSMLIIKNKTKPAKLFSKVSAPFCIPMNNVWKFQFLYILTSTFHFVYYSHSSGCEVVPASVLVPTHGASSLSLFVFTCYKSIFQTVPSPESLFFFFVDPPKPQVISFFKFFKTLLISLVVCFFPYVAFFCVCILSLCYNILVIFESLRRYSEARREEGRLWYVQKRKLSKCLCLFDSLSLWERTAPRDRERERD